MSICCGRWLSMGAMPTLVVGMSCFPVFPYMPTTSVGMAPIGTHRHPPSATETNTLARKRRDTHG